MISARTVLNWYDAILEDYDRTLAKAILTTDMLLMVRDHIGGRPYDPVAAANGLFEDYRNQRDREGKPVVGVLV
tara:strand:- start:9 stop:230 length:222 start_codon:yes stop_codon:yes gene_type:complete